MNSDPERPKNRSWGCPGGTQGSFIRHPQTILSQTAEKSPIIFDLSCRSCGLVVLSIFMCFFFFFFIMIATFLLLTSWSVGRTGHNSIWPAFHQISWDGKDFSFLAREVALDFQTLLLPAFCVLFLLLRGALVGSSLRQKCYFLAEQGSLKPLSWLSFVGWQCNASLGPQRSS